MFAQEQMRLPGARGAGIQGAAQRPRPMAGKSPAPVKEDVKSEMAGRATAGSRERV